MEANRCSNAASVQSSCGCWHYSEARTFVESKKTAELQRILFRRIREIAPTAIMNHNTWVSAMNAPDMKAAGFLSFIINMNIHPRHG